MLPMPRSSTHIWTQYHLCGWRQWLWLQLTSLCCRLGKAPDVVVVSSNLWDASLYAEHGAARSADLPPDLVVRWLADAGAVFGEIKVCPHRSLPNLR